jgi:DNA invertase Pin-like site-specific DNA recombinase
MENTRYTAEGDKEAGTMNKAVCYIRVSTEEQVRGGVSLEAQEEKLIAYCRLQGLEVVRIIREEGVSGSKPLETRPGGEELAKLVGSGRIQHVIALKLDRLFRDAENALNQTRRWDNSGIAMHLVDMGGQAINTASAMGRMFLTMMAGFAELERNLIAERTQAALAHKKSHKEAYSPIPYGYDRDGKNLVENPTEQEALRTIQQWYGEGKSLRAIARNLNEQGIPTKSEGQERNGKPVAGKWYAATIKYILGNTLHQLEAA